MKEKQEYITQRQFKDSMEHIDERFDCMDKKFEFVNNKFDSVDKKFEFIEKQFESVDKRFDIVHEKIEGAVSYLDYKIDALSTKIDTDVVVKLDKILDVVIQIKENDQIQNLRLYRLEKNFNN